MAKNLNEREFDIRLVERRLRFGKIDTKAYQEHLKTLPDSTNNLQYLEVFEDKDATIVENLEDGLAFTLQP